MSTLRSALRAYGPVDGVLIWSARLLQRRSHRAAWPFWAMSNRYESWRFKRMWDRIEKRTAAQPPPRDEGQPTRGKAG